MVSCRSTAATSSCREQSHDPPGTRRQHGVPAALGDLHVHAAPPRDRPGAARRRLRRRALRHQRRLPRRGEAGAAHDSLLLQPSAHPPSRARRDGPQADPPRRLRRRAHDAVRDRADLRVDHRGVRRYLRGGLQDHRRGGRPRDHLPDPEGRGTASRAAGHRSHRRPHGHLRHAVRSQVGPRDDLSSRARGRPPDPREGRPDGDSRKSLLPRRSPVVVGALPDDARSRDPPALDGRRGRGDAADRGRRPGLLHLRHRRHGSVMRSRHRGPRDRRARQLAGHADHSGPGRSEPRGRGPGRGVAALRHERPHVDHGRPHALRDRLGIRGQCAPPLGRRAERRGGAPVAQRRADKDVTNP